MAPRRTFAPLPPRAFPPARTVQIADRGEFFLRDSGGDGPPLMLLHGWMASADMNWYGVYDDVIAAGYRVLAIDHRGHGRGLRSFEPFRLVDCAADAAAVLRELGAAPAVIVGYSMGGAIGQLIARDRPDVLAGLVLSGTAQHWQEPEIRRVWRGMGALGLALSVAPRRAVRSAMRRGGLAESQRTAWMQAELTRNSASDIAEAGRELGRFDSRPWLRPLPVRAAVVVTTRDEAVPPRKQRELATALNAETFDAPIDHLEVTTAADRYSPPLLQAIARVRTPAGDQSGAAVR